MKFTLFVIISIMICGSLNAQHFETNIQELYQRGYYYYDNEDYEKAIKFFDDILEIDSNHYYANMYKGIALISLNKLNEGLILLKKPFLLDSIQNHALIYLMIGEAYLHLDEYDMAIENISKSISSEPMFGYSFMIRGSSYTRTNEYEKAIEDFNRAIELGEETLLIYFERGTAYYFMGNYEAAATDFLTVSQNSKNDFVQVDYYLGEIFFEYKYFEKAISHFTTFIQNKTDDTIKNLHAIFKMGVSNYFLGNYKEALKYFDEIKEEPDYLGAFIYKGMTYIALEDIDKASTNLEIALSKDPQNSLANYQMGILEFLSKNTEKGNEYFNVAKERAYQTKDEFTLFGLAESNMLLGDTTNALDCLNKVIFLNPNHYKALEARISLNSYFLLEKESDVLDDFELLLKVFKGNEQITAYYIAQKSIFLFELGRFDQSIAELEKAIQVHSYFEYYALRALLLTYKELKISQNLNRSTIPDSIQTQILQDVDNALQSNHRRKDAYLLKITILIALDRNKEACEVANEAIKLGASINKDQLNYICKGKKPKEKNNEWEFFYNLSSFDERFSQ